MEADDVIVKTTPEQSLARVLRDWILVIAIALGAAMLVRVFVLQQFYISGPSMEATLFQDNRVLVNKLSYRLHPIHRGDVVVFDRVTTSGSIVTHDDLIKRVIGVATDSVEIKQCKVFVNGTEISEPYLNKNQVALTNMVSRCRVVDMPKVVVPKGQLFVMGDNRPESFDSRSFGTIPKNLVVGRAFAIVWPFSRIRGL
ncbi:MAG: signal peptidase I [Actinomycetes bacterium]|jgi:signal peptidase I